METIATHPGIVIASTSQEVQVKMEVLSACASCQAHSHCGFAEKKDKIVNIATRDWQDYHPGDTVNVIINSGRGIQAAIIAYLIPAILLLLPSSHSSPSTSPKHSPSSSPSLSSPSTALSSTSSVLASKTSSPSASRRPEPKTSPPNQTSYLFQQIVVD